MGTINYCTSNYITMGFRPAQFSDFTDDECFMEEYKDLSEEELNERIYDEMYFNDECDYGNAKYIIEHSKFYYYHVALKPGYYAGCYLDIENNFPLFYDDYREKQDTKGNYRDKEISH